MIYDSSDNDNDNDNDSDGDDKGSDGEGGNEDDNHNSVHNYDCNNCLLQCTDKDHCVSREAWIGLHDLNANGVYRWMDGSYPYIYHHWKDGPVNTGTDLCVAKTPSDTWINTNCSEEKPYVCSRPIGKSQDTRYKIQELYFCITD